MLWLPLTLLAAPPAADVLGVTHIGGRYHLTDGDYLNEGADQLLELGCRVIKLHFSPSVNHNNVEQAYRFGPPWPRTTTLVELADTPFFRAVFDKPFETYVLWAYPGGNHGWREGLSPADAAAESEQMEALTRLLLSRYRGTNKTFILSHWEGDWSIRPRTDPALEPTPTAIQGMVDWLRARQAGVDRARAAVGEEGVRVWHAAEVNLVARTVRDGAPNVVNTVLPQVELDLVSYSAYDSQNDPDLLRQCLECIARHARTKAPLARDVFVGEFGWPENEVPRDRAEPLLRGAWQTAREWGCPWIIYWQLYCNEPRREPVTGNDDLRGFWLVKPDGSRSWVGSWLAELLRG